MNRFQQIENTLIFQFKHERLQIEPWGKNSLRVRAVKGLEIHQREELSALLSVAPEKTDIKISDEKAVITNGKISAEITSEGQLTFYKSSDHSELLAEHSPHFLLAKRKYTSLGSDLFHIETRFKAYTDEHIYGMGQQPNGHLDQKGMVIDLLQHNTLINIPFYISTRGYGFLWNNPAVGRVEFGNNHTRWIAEATRQIDYWITAEDSPEKIMEQYTEVTGRSPMLPEWAAGFWQSKLRYRSQEELLEIAREYKKRNLPISIIVIDFFHWTLMGDWKFDPELWPDPKAMVKELEDMGIKAMVSFWPTVNLASENFEEMMENGFITDIERGLPAHFSFFDNNTTGPVSVHYYDATSEKAREYVWNKLQKNYYEHGIKIFWLDSCEPDMEPKHPDNLRFAAGQGLEIFNKYPMENARMVYEGLKKAGDNEIITLCRSGWAGVQRYGAALWSGDIPSTFEMLEIQVTAGLNVAMSGVPWWTTDIGGFYGGNPTTPYFQELIVRWFQFGVFCPLFRLHGVRLPEQKGHCGAPNEVWSFGDKAYDLITDMLFLRERLKPYIMQQMELAHKKGIPPMRPLIFDFPADSNCVNLKDQFLLGPDILIAPIVKQGATERSVYLPKGADWVYAKTTEKFQGGQFINVQAPLNTIPVFLKNDAKIPVFA